MRTQSRKFRRAMAWGMGIAVAMHVGGGTAAVSATTAGPAPIGISGIAWIMAAQISDRSAAADAAQPGKAGPSRLYADRETSGVNVSDSSHDIEDAEVARLVGWHEEATGTYGGEPREDVPDSE